MNASITHKEVIRTKNGVKITLDDQKGRANLLLETPDGQKVILQDDPATIRVEDSNGNSVELQSSGITVTSASHVTVSAGSATISAGMLTVDAGMSNFSGVVKCDELVTNSVVSASYSPGAGNIW